LRGASEGRRGVRWIRRPGRVRGQGRRGAKPYDPNALEPPFEPDKWGRHAWMRAMHFKSPSVGSTEMSQPAWIIRIKEVSLTNCQTAKLGGRAILSKPRVSQASKRNDTSKARAVIESPVAVSQSLPVRPKLRRRGLRRPIAGPVAKGTSTSGSRLCAASGAGSDLGGGPLDKYGGPRGCPADPCVVVVPRIARVEPPDPIWAEGGRRLVGRFPAGRGRVIGLRPPQPRHRRGRSWGRSIVVGGHVARRCGDVFQAP